MSTGDRVAELKPRSKSERRAFARSDRKVAIKLRRCANAIFSSGCTLDVSMGGASIEIAGPREVHDGERIAIAFENHSCPVTRASRMIGAQIVRAQPMCEGRQRVAVRFDAPQAGLVGIGQQAAA